MPKQKTKSAAKKRFVVTASGRIKRKQMNTRHILTKKTRKRKNRLRGLASVDKSNQEAVSRMLTDR